MTDQAVIRAHVSQMREQFPILNRKVHGDKQLVYLDNAATTQKPSVVIEALENYYRNGNSNVHRGVHEVSAEATTMYERTRSNVRDFINASRDEEIVYTSGTTEAVNLVASSWGETNINPGDEILITLMEHHANIVPWQMLCKKFGATLRFVPVLEDGSLDLEAVPGMLNERTKMFSMTHASNTLGSINPVKDLCAMAEANGTATFVDGAQMIVHQSIDVQDIGCDFYAFSAHKLYGPTGVGVLYGRYKMLENMPPYQGGGAMIKKVTVNGSTFGLPPLRFEAGTPHIAGICGLEATLNWFRDQDVQNMFDHERSLTVNATEGLTEIDGLRIIGTTANKIGIISFVVDGCDGSDIGTLCDEQGIALRAGHHCTMPLMEHYGLGSVIRASFAAYTSQEDVEALILSVKKAVKLLR